MRNSSYLAFAVLAFVFMPNALAGGENTATVNGVTVRFDWKAVPAGPGETKWVGGVQVQRHFGFHESHKYFGYDLKLERIPSKRLRYRVTISRLTMTPEAMSRLFKGTWTMVPEPRESLSMEMAPGDVMGMDLFTWQATGQKIVDYVRIEPTADASTASIGPVDFTVDVCEWTVASPKLTISGAPFDMKGAGGATITGTPLWIYIKGHGRFVFSFRPRPELGLVKAGEVEGSEMWWTAGGTRYEIRAESRIAPGDGKYNLYVYRAENWAPKENDTIQFGAGGPLEGLVRGGRGATVRN
jgi:hypothetical protein